MGLVSFEMGPTARGWLTPQLIAQAYKKTEVVLQENQDELEKLLEVETL